MVRSLEQKMFAMYEDQSGTMQTKLAELFATFDRIEKLKSELKDFKQALGCLYQDVS